MPSYLFLMRKKIELFYYVRVCEVSAKHHKLRASRSICTFFKLNREKTKLSILYIGNHLLFYVVCQIANPSLHSIIFSLVLVLVLFAIFILHSRESELYRYTLDGKSALAWELPFSRIMGHLSST